PRFTSFPLIGRRHAPASQTHHRILDHRGPGRGVGDVSPVVPVDARLVYEASDTRADKCRAGVPCPIDAGSQSQSGMDAERLDCISRVVHADSGLMAAISGSPATSERIAAVTRVGGSTMTSEQPI